MDGQRLGREAEALVEFAAQAKLIGLPHQHPWNGLGLSAVPPTLLEHLRPTLSALLDRIDELRSREESLRRLMDSTSQLLTSVSRTELIKMAEHLGDVPAKGRVHLGHPRWDLEARELRALIEKGEALSRRRAKLEETFLPEAFAIDPEPIIGPLKRYGGSWYRAFVRRYRKAKAEMKALLASGLQVTPEEALALLEDVSATQRAVADFAADDVQHERGSQAFGEQWQGIRSEWASLKALVRWESRGRELGLSGAFRKVAALVSSPGDARAAGRQLSEVREDVQSRAEVIIRDMQIDLGAAFGHQSLSELSEADLRQKVLSWHQSNQQQLRDWVRYQALRRQVEEMGLGALAQLFEAGQLSPEHLLPILSCRFHEGLLAQAHALHPELSSFDGPSHDREVARFRQLDRGRIELTRSEVEDAHRARLPQLADYGEVGVIYQEMKKKRKHRPVRVLLADAGRAVQTIKPVFLMSPLSVAQFLRPGGIEFDLLLIDEASQVRPVDALGAIARARQVVVVGDDKQLPPTSFFDRAVGEADGVEGDFEAADVESILDLCVASGLKSRMLRWHYRSKHESLIALSNRELYASQLIIPPGPTRTDDALGLKFRYVENAVYDRGGSSTNRTEARAVAQAAVAHARRWPEKTLGVGTFSASQRDAIEEELGTLTNGHSDLDPFFSADKPDRFFVKNLESIQGDERDVIFISVGYGRDASGTLRRNFGPLVNEGGEKRLNVLITRARERCEVFASFRSDDLDLRGVNTRGPHLLKAFLKYAETGSMDVPRSPSSDYDSEFERHVATRLREKGFSVDTQVGSAGFRIDLAIVDPEHPGRYLLGVECDGAQYHSSQWARDRDRLRQEILESRGWTIHRIWSTDWFNSPERQMGLLLEAIERARLAGRYAEGKQSPEQRRETPAEPSPSSQLVAEAMTARREADRYREADFAVNNSVPIPDLSIDELSSILERIVQIEGPLHEEELARRMTSLWDLKRTGSRITDAVTNALRYLVSRGRVAVDEGFCSIPGVAVRVRRREDVNSSSLRKAGCLPPAEIRAAILLVVEQGIGVRAEEACEEALHLFGFKAISENLRTVTARQLSRLVEEGTLQAKDGRLYVAPKS